MNRIETLFMSTALLTSALVSDASAQARLFGVDGSDLIEFDPSNGAVIASIPLFIGAGYTVEALAYDPVTNTLFAAMFILGTSTAASDLCTIDYTNGALSVIGPFNGAAPAFAMHGLEIDDTGQLYGYSGYDIVMGARFFRVDRTTGHITPISNPGLWAADGLGFDSSTGTMYLGDPTYDQLLTIDRTTGVTTIVGPYGPAGAAAGQVGTGMAYDPQYGMYAVSNTSTDSLWRLDLSTGAATHIADLTTNNLLSLAFVGGGTPGSAFCFGDGSGAACPCGNSSANGAHSGCSNSLNEGGQLAASGIASLTNDTTILHGTNMPNSSALYFQGTTQTNGGLGNTFGDGLRCAGGSIVRLGATMNVGGTSQYPFGTFPAIHVKGNITAPGTRTYQLWYRNAAPFCTPSTFNLTNGWQLSWIP